MKRFIVVLSMLSILLLVFVPVTLQAADLITTDKKGMKKVSLFMLLRKVVAKIGLVYTLRQMLLSQHHPFYGITLRQTVINPGLLKYI